MASNLRAVLAARERRYYLAWWTNDHILATPQRLEWRRVNPGGLGAQSWAAAIGASQFSVYASGTISADEFTLPAPGQTYQVRIAYGVGYASFTNEVTLAIEDEHGAQDIEISILANGPRTFDLVTNTAPIVGVAMGVIATAPPLHIADVIISGNEVARVILFDCVCRKITNVRSIGYFDPSENYYPAYLDGDSYYAEVPINTPLTLVIDAPDRFDEPLNITYSLEYIDGAGYSLVGAPEFPGCVDAYSGDANTLPLQLPCNGSVTVEICDFCAPPEGNDYALIKQEILPGPILEEVLITSGRIESTGPGACTSVTFNYLGPGAYRVTFVNAQNVPLNHVFQIL